MMSSSILGNGELKNPEMTVSSPHHECEEELNGLRDLLRSRDEKIADLTSQLDKYRSVFRNSGESRCSGGSGGSSDWYSSSPSSSWQNGVRLRGVGISAEPISAVGAANPEARDSNRARLLIKVHKTDRLQALIRRAVLENEFMRNLDPRQTQSIIDCMRPVSFPEKSVIIQEGDVGSSVYVLESGLLTVSKKGRLLRDIIKPTVFGELAILYDCMRTATVTAHSDCQLWSIDRPVFQAIMMSSGLLKREEHLEFLKSVPTFRSMEDERLGKIADLLDEASYSQGDYIIRQGGRGDTFYIIAEGRVRVTKSDQSGLESERFIRHMERGDWFGEKALTSQEDVRTANIIVDCPEGVTCLVLDRDSYMSLIDSTGLKKYYLDEQDASIDRDLSLFEDATIADFETVAILGVGGFGRVELVRLRHVDGKSFAMKRMKKAHIVRTRQQEHVINERSVLLQVNCQFVVKLYKTYRDAKYLYMVMEVCLGGELWSILRDRKRFEESTTRFCIASVIEAFSYLHGKQIVYRDLKPENLMVDNIGYLKLTDFGFAKLVPLGRKTWTFCGTPEYVAPEVILNKGHDCGADYWSLGVLVYELLSGMPPFYATDPMKVYTLILKGVDSVNFERVSRNAQNLIKKLCRDNPTDRLGYGSEGVKACQKHIWFESFNWEGLNQQSIKSPIHPVVKSPLDCSNFDNYQDTESDTEEDNSGWDKQF